MGVAHVGVAHVLISRSQLNVLNNNFSVCNIWYNKAIIRVQKIGSTFEMHCSLTCASRVDKKLVSSI